MMLNLYIDINESHKYMRTKELKSEIVKHLNSLGCISIESECGTYINKAGIYSIRFRCRVINSKKALSLYKRIEESINKRFYIREINIDCV